MVETIETELKKFRNCVENMKYYDKECDGCYCHMSVCRFGMFYKLMKDIEG